MRFILLLVGLSGCKSLSGLPPVVDLNKLVKQVKNDPTDVAAIHKQAQKTHRSIKAQVGSVKQPLAALESVVGRKWGKQNTQQPSDKKYVKYSNDYQARAIIDFEQGIVKVETIALKIQ
eukprot:UN05918